MRLNNKYLHLFVLYNVIYAEKRFCRFHFKSKTTVGGFLFPRSPVVGLAAYSVRAGMECTVIVGLSV